MLKNKLLLLSLIFAISGISANAETLSDLTYPKPPAYRVGISEVPENQYVQAKQTHPKVEKTYAQIDDTKESSLMDVTYADLSIKNLSREIAQELELDEQEMIADLSLLWQGAAIQSDTINFALYKLANPDADKPDKNSVKNVLKTIASMSTLVGASMGSPLLAGSSLIGGNILGIMTQDTKALNYKYTKVNDADMIILIRKVEDLQQNAVNLYYDYMSAKKQYEMATKLVESRERKFELAQQNNAPRELVVITDAYYRTAIDKQRSAKSEFFSKRAALEQFVGNEYFVQFEKELHDRENGSDNSASQSMPPNKEEPTYGETIQNVENYTNNLNNSTNQSSEKPINTQYTKDYENNNSNQLYTDEMVDPNLDKIPDLEPLDLSPKKNNAEVKDFDVMGELPPLKNEEVKKNSPKTEKGLRLKKEKDNSKSEKGKFFKKEKGSDKEETLSIANNLIAFGRKSDVVSDVEETFDLQDEEEINNDNEFVNDEEKQVNDKDKNSEKDKNKKSLKSKVSEFLTPKTNEEKYSTKGLIFLHGRTKEEALYDIKNNIPYEKSSTQKDKKEKTTPLETLDDIELRLHNLPPLDEIMAPDMQGQGYSIHSIEGYY